jgi:SPP1 family predicted phage head-tail adaptor
MDDICLLIPTVVEKDATGVQRTTELESRQVFCRVRSISRAEFYKAGETGLRPALIFVVFHGDYQGEMLLEYRGERYAIYRTYRGPDSGSGLQKSGMRSQYDYGADYMELYAEQKGGTNGKASGN